ncbi:ubiquitin-conjugating enzyme E2 [Trypanosoma theileri]|uniref:Ubiquitin-conjugating enzyme E2 n=1 Tax=Trypanosoma theileri TaxID=67003 RepID=A0A1X0P9M3_9TRYP|nr:ubiquitin-conjugating enzyme E2 [Trypanosoma theileri]ORC93578.1 ubiquitin-conjugating enzyme E2 [Trypanosoma theileri]
MSAVATKRIGKDLQLLLASIKSNNGNNTTGPVVISVDSQTLQEWYVEAKAPVNSIYHKWSDGSERIYKLLVSFTDEFPHEAPKVRFLSVPYSPLVTPDGSVCEEIIVADWSPDQHALDAIMLVLEKVFCTYVESPEEDIFHEARDCLEKNPEEFTARVQQRH